MYLELMNFVLIQKIVLMKKFEFPISLHKGNQHFNKQYTRSKRFQKMQLKIVQQNKIREL